METVLKKQNWWKSVTNVQFKKLEKLRKMHLKKLGIKGKIRNCYYMKEKRKNS